MSANLLKIGVLRETMKGERRVALTPADVKRLSSRAIIFVEKSAGVNAAFSDDAYVEAGAEISSLEDMIGKANILVKIRQPEFPENFSVGSIVISLGGRDPNLAEAMKKKGVIYLGLERLPRITRAQSMDVLSSQAAIAGYEAVLEGARTLDILLPMLTTAAGTIRPAKMIALGAGVAGLQAIATARRLGAITHGFDVREAAREQVESLGAKFVFPDVELPSAEGAGGYAASQSADQQSRLRRALAEYLIPMQLIITSAQIPGQKAPLLIDTEAVALMQYGTVIVDLAAETGGNCELTRPDEIVVTENGVRVLGPTNISSDAATDASRFFSVNVRSLLEHLISNEGLLQLDSEDPITSALLAGQTLPVQKVV
ncbi:MAG: NAD(P) transhydrogenase subunit alpha [Gammaproteobacteria bacterium]|nr:NAD(P) transhydrogenase subunit alpha [Gammaproteobacteria bacterium]